MTVQAESIEGLRTAVRGSVITPLTPATTMRDASGMPSSTGALRPSSGAGPRRT